MSKLSLMVVVLWLCEFVEIHTGIIHHSMELTSDGEQLFFNNMNIITLLQKINKR
jgi:hypothetical protein